MKLKIRHIAGCFILLLGMTGSNSYAADIDEAAKYKLQSVFMYNFISSVEWPRLVYTNDEKTIDLCIIGQDKLGSVIDEVAKKAASKGVVINVRRGVTAETAGDCNMAYIVAGEAAAVTPKLQGKPVLTVSEEKGFAKAGGIIEFSVQGGNVRFSINNHLAKEHGLKINPQLLEAALEVIN